MFRRFAAAALVLVAAFASSCASPPSTPPHDCLAYWGANTDALMPELDAMKTQHGIGWARRLMDQATFDALEGLKEDLQNARAQPVTVKTKDQPGIIPQAPPLDAIQAYALCIRNGVAGDPAQGGLAGDANSGCHMPGSPAGWLNTLVAPDGSTTPNSPLVLTKADLLLAKLKDALDM